LSKGIAWENLAIWAAKTSTGSVNISQSKISEQGGVVKDPHIGEKIVLVVLLIV